MLQHTSASSHRAKVDVHPLEGYVIAPESDTKQEGKQADSVNDGLNKTGSSGAGAAGSTAGALFAAPPTPGFDGGAGSPGLLRSPGNPFAVLGAAAPATAGTQQQQPQQQRAGADGVGATARSGGGSKSAGAAAAASAAQSFTGKMLRMQRHFELNGCVRSVEAVIMAHQHGHPHVLLLRMAGTNIFRLPGGKCHAGESDIECLERKLLRRLFADRKSDGGNVAGGGGTSAPAGSGVAVGSSASGVQLQAGSSTGVVSALQPQAQLGGGGSGTGGAASGGAAAGGLQQTLPFRCGETLASWVRPNFDRHMYPYRPPHVVSEKEVRTIYSVQIDPELSFSVDPRYQLVAAPLFELHNNAVKYGNIIASIPIVVSRLQINLCEAQGQ